MVIHREKLLLSPLVSGLALASALAATPHALFAQGSSATLEEVIITARKVYEPMQDVPIAVPLQRGHHQCTGHA